MLRTSHAMKALIVFLACTVVSHAANDHPIISVRETPDIMVEGVQATELWLTTPDKSTPELIVRGHADPDMEKIICNITDPALSPDNRFIYFLSDAWVVSGSLQKVEISTKNVSFVIDACGFEIIKTGIFEGLLLVDRHLIEDKGRASYLWLVSPDGKLRMQIGEFESDAAHEFRKLYIPEPKGSGL